jgi:protein dithiol:quinone oxidoreductase
MPGSISRLGARGWNLLGASACAALIGYALYSEHVLGYMPCPLCIFQRVGIIALGVVFLIAALHAPRGRGRYVYAALVGIAALATAGIAARHVYIQTLPPGTVPSCGAPLDVMLQFSPFFDVVKNVLTASGECGNIDWTFLGLSMPAWVLVCAVALGALGVVANARPAKSQTV